jgi:arginase
MMTQPLSALTVLGIRYRGTTPAPDDERALDRYAAAQVYDAAGVPISHHEPVAALPDGLSPTERLGAFGGIIAAHAADARRAGHGIVLVGGDCSHITGIIGGLQRAEGAACRIGLVWFDAHGDYNTPRTTRSGMLGGMPVAVAAGLAYPEWREGSAISAPLPTERILLVDVRNLDPDEERLIRATETSIVPIDGPAFDAGLAALCTRCDLLYLHIDSDILDARFVPNHGTVEPDGPDLERVCLSIGQVMATGRVAAFAVVSVYGSGPGSAISVASGMALIRAGLAAWHAGGRA